MTVQLGFMPWLPVFGKSIRRNRPRAEAAPETVTTPVSDTSARPPRLGAKRRAALKDMDYARLPDRQGLSQEIWEALMNALGENPEAQYLTLHAKLCKFFEARAYYDAERAADTVLERVGRHLIEGKPVTTTLSRLAMGFANVHWLELRSMGWQQKDRIITGPEGKERDLLDTLRDEKAPNPESQVMNDKTPSEILADCLESCLQKLAAADRQTLLAYYDVPPGRDKAAIRVKLAESLGMKPQALREHIFRLRRRVERCTSDCCQEHGLKGGEIE